MIATLFKTRHTAEIKGILHLAERMATVVPTSIKGALDVNCRILE